IITISKCVGINCLRFLSQNLLYWRINMSKKNSEFFRKKNIWSEVKDDLLSWYLVPYVQKILKTRRPLFYVDCFAGKGRFDDGNKGSPLIALEIINDCLKRTTVQRARVESCFIELNHADDL